MRACGNSGTLGWGFSWVPHYSVPKANEGNTKKERIASSLGRENREDWVCKGKNAEKPD